MVIMRIVKRVCGGEFCFKDLCLSVSVQTVLFGVIKVVSQNNNWPD